MKSKVIYCFAAVVFAVNTCQAITIVVGNHPVFANTPGQIIQINVSGLGTDLVHAMDLNVQIGNTPAPHTPPSGPSPTISYDNSAVQDLNNNIFSPVPHDVGDGGSTPYAIFLDEVLQTITGPNSAVVANGGLITLVVDTTGFNGGAWPLIMDSANVAGTTDFVDVHANVIPDVSITNGFIFIPIPEPASIVIGSVALAALGGLAVRERRSSTINC